MSKKDRNRKNRKELRRRQRRIRFRLRNRVWDDQPRPMLRGVNLHYEIAERARGMVVAGIGVIHQLVVRLGLVKAINRALSGLLKVHLPYWESDHVLNIAYNIMCGGTRLEDIELRRNDEVFLDALGAQRIPDPTTAGDFTRRFEPHHVEALQEAVNRKRLDVWAQQPQDFFNEAVLDVDGTLAPTYGERKEGMDITFKGSWGYHPLVVSLANTREPLYLVNRRGNRPSHEGAAAYIDKSIALCREAGFLRILVRGDTDFSQTRHLDRWDDVEGVQFIFGMDASRALKQRAEELSSEDWRRLRRRPKYVVATEPRTRRENVKERIVRERGFKNIRLNSEEVAEFDYQPSACKKTYRIVVVRKNLTIESGEDALFDDIRYFFYITNRREVPAEGIVYEANDRCEQENLIEQLKNGVKALNMPVHDLASNWAYMVMAALAWSLKAWYALVLPTQGRWEDKHKAEKQTVLRMEFKRFLDEFIRLPCQVVIQGRRIVYKLLSWNRWSHVFLRGIDAVEALPR